MSPSESDLRAALRDGEGDNIDVDHLILGVRADASRRKVRLLTTLSIAGVLACAGGAGALIANSGGSDTAGSSMTAQAAGGLSGAIAAPHATGSLIFGVNGGGNLSSTVAGCPTGDEVTASNGGGAGAGGSGGNDKQAGAPAHGEILFRPVRAVLVCVYGVAAHDALTPKPSPRSVLLRGADASRLTASLEQAPTTKPTGFCPDVRGPASTLLMIGLNPDGSVAGTARTVLGMPVCNVVVFSAGAPRYNWRLPVELAPALRSLTQAALPTAKVIGSPISS